MRSYAPIVVNKPTSMHHTVRLFPNQEFALRLSSDIKVLKIDPLIKMTERSILNNGDLEISFSQDSKVENWAESSSVYLGNVFCKTVDGTKFRLCVSTESSNYQKKDLVTVYNPESQFVKIDANQILHVVVYDNCFGPSDVWKWTFDNNETDLDIDLHQLGKREVELAKFNFCDNRKKEDIYYLEKKSNDFFHPSCREHQYWFRFDNRLLPMIRTKTNKVYFVGNVEFYGFNSLGPKDGNIEALRSLELWINLKNKHANKFTRLMGLDDYGSSSVETKSSTIPIIHRDKKSKNKSYSKFNSSSNSSSSKFTSKSSGKNYYTENYKNHRKVAEIDIFELKEGEKCVTRSLLPSENPDYYDVSQYRGGCSYHDHGIYAY